MPNRPLRIGVLGCSKHAMKLMLPAMEASTRRVKIVAIASRSNERAASFGARFGCDGLASYQAVLDRDDVDAVYLPLPSALHVEWGIRALKAGKHVLCEKPLTATFDGARELDDMAQVQGLVVMESFMFLAHRQHRAVAEQLADGAIGELKHFTASFGFPSLPADDIRNRPELGGGALLDAGVYPVKAAQLFLGPQLRVLGAARLMSRETRVDVAGSALLSNPAGATASVTWGFDHQYRCEYSLWGSEGHLALDRAFTPPVVWKPALTLTRGLEQTALDVPADDQFRRIVKTFCRAVATVGDHDPLAVEATTPVERLFLNDAGWLNRGESMLAHAHLVEQITELADVRWSPAGLTVATG